MTKTPAVGFPIRGLYVLTPAAIPDLEQLEAMAAAALICGAIYVVVQRRALNTTFGDDHLCRL